MSRRSIAIHRISSFQVRHTIRWGHVRDIGVVCCLASEKTDTRRAADGDSAIVSSVKRSLVCYVLLDQGHIVHRRQVQVLIIRNDEDEVGLAELLPTDVEEAPHVSTRLA